MDTDILYTIKLLQIQRGLSDAEFSRQIGINHATWSKIKSGKRNAGIKFYRLLATAFPELKTVVAVAIVGNNYTTPEKRYNQKLRGFRSLLVAFHKLGKKLFIKSSTSSFSFPFFKGE